jgi:hypothetical protein
MTFANQIIVAGSIGLLISWFYNRIKTKEFKIFLFLIIPLIIAVFLFWAPNINHLNDLEYQTWAPLSIGFFYVGGILGNAIGCALKTLFLKITGRLGKAERAQLYRNTTNTIICI